VYRAFKARKEYKVLLERLALKAHRVLLERLDRKVHRVLLGKLALKARKEDKGFGVRLDLRG
jgi:limonene-1,2-epoxide hydrolase